MEGETKSAAATCYDSIFEEVSRLRQENAALKEKLAAAKNKIRNLQDGRSRISLSDLAAALEADIESLKTDNVAFIDVIGDCGNALIRLQTHIKELTCVTAEIVKELRERQKT